MLNTDIVFLGLKNSTEQYLELQRMHEAFMRGRGKSPINLENECENRELDTKYKYMATCPGCRSVKVEWETWESPGVVRYIPWCFKCNPKRVKRGWFWWIWGV